ncbi:MAG TPA: preprotein translocase subunit SecE [Candidatus Paceibacterota bacterium]|nr:preprotein translocase subunit SecE [Candidatus Paceibacterota bacterium]
MDAIMQYLKGTRAELRHVAWPTQTQTIVYTLLVAGLSLAVAAYLGLFDFLFTTALSSVVNNLPESTPAAQTESTTTPLSTGSPITITPSTTTTK